MPADFSNISLSHDITNQNQSNDDRRRRRNESSKIKIGPMVQRNNIHPF